MRIVRAPPVFLLQVNQLEGGSLGTSRFDIPQRIDLGEYAHELECKFEALKDTYSLKSFIESKDDGEYTTVVKTNNWQKWVEIDGDDKIELDIETALANRKPLLAVFIRD